MSHLNLFSMHNLALLSDWLQETGELFVDIYYLHGAGGYNERFIHSMNDLKTIVAEETWRYIAITIYRRKQYPLRGIADEKLLEQALQLIPDGESIAIVYLSLANYRALIYEYSSDSTHEKFKASFAEVLGEEVGIGHEPFRTINSLSRTDEVFNVEIRTYNPNPVVKNQDYYEPYANEPERYQWLAELWRV